MVSVGYQDGDRVAVQDAMRVVSTWVSGDANIKVVYHKGRDVSADIHNGIIKIPAVGTISGESMMLLRSWVYHEAGHIKHTKMSKKDHPKGVLFRILNCIEDVRMEHLVGGEYLGARTAFIWSVEHYNKKLGARFSEDSDHPVAECLSAMMMVAQYKTPAWTLSPMAQEYVDAALVEFLRVRQANSTYESLEIAKRVFEILKQKKMDESEPDKNPDDQDESESGDQEESGSQDSPDSDPDPDSDDSCDPDDELNDDDEENTTGKPKSVNGDEDEDESDETQASSGDEDEDEDESTSASQDEDESEDESEDEESGMSESEAEEALADESDDEDKAKSLAKDIRDRLDDDQANPSLDGWYTACRDNDIYHEVKATRRNIEDFTIMRRELASSIMSLSRGLDQMLRCMTRTRRRPNMEHGKIDMSRLTTIAKSLSRDIFYNTSRGRALDTAVVVVIDESGSMITDNRFMEARRLAVALGECLNPIGVPFEIYGGTTPNDPVRNTYDGVFTRWTPIVHNIYKTWNEQWSSPSVRARVMNISSNCHNVDGEWVEWAAYRLRQRKEARRIIFSISDGRPLSGQGNENELVRNLIESCGRARKEGMEVYGIGVNTDAPRKYYGKENFLHVKNACNLGIDFMTMLSKVLMRGMTR